MRQAEEYLRPGQVAAIFDVKPDTVARWARAGRLTVIRTLGGHRRYLASEVRAIKGGKAEQ